MQGLNQIKVILFTLVSLTGIFHATHAAKVVKIVNKEDQAFRAFYKIDDNRKGMVFVEPFEEIKIYVSDEECKKVHVAVYRQDPFDASKNRDGCRDSDVSANYLLGEKVFNDTPNKAGKGTHELIILLRGNRTKPASQFYKVKFQILRHGVVERLALIK